MKTRIGHVAAGSWSFPKLPITRPELPQRSNMEWSPKIQSCIFLIFATFGHYIWKAIAPRSKHSGTPKLELKVQRVCTIDGSPQPLLVIYTYGASASDYTCRPNIHYLLYSSLMPMYYHALLFCLTNYMHKCANKLHTLIYVGCIFASRLNIGLHYTKLIAAT